MSVAVDYLSPVRSVDQFSLAFEISPIPLLMVSPSGEIALTNSELDATFGYPDGSLVGESIEILLPKESRTKHPKLRANFSRSPRKRSMGHGLHLHGVKRDGEIIPIEIGLNPVQIAGDVWTVATVIDISERLAAEQRLRAASEAAAKAEELAENYRSLEHFSEVAAHDLKAPLRNITTLLGFLKEDYGASLPQSALDLVERTESAAGRLQVLILDLLSHAKSGASQLQCEQIQLDQIITTVIDNNAATLDACGGKVDIDGCLGGTRGDPLLVYQLFENLITNAVKYRDSSRPLTVTVSAANSANGQRRISVKDNGIGFDNAYCEALFEPFKRLHAESDIEGNGVGLATCRTICRRHGWLIHAHGEPGIGAEFEIQLGAS